MYWRRRMKSALISLTTMSRLGGLVFIVSVTTVIQVLMAMDVPMVKLNDGREIPAIALGTYLGFDQNGIIKPKGDDLRVIIRTAIDIGWRNFDTAAIYGTENAIGVAIKDKIAEGNIKRENVFITTKLWNTHHKRDHVTQALRESLRQLETDYVDLYLMHWPISLHENYTFDDIDFMETWRGMEDVFKLGLARSIGLSNFNKEQIDRVLKEGSVKPAALQIEVHPKMIQSELVTYAQAHGIVVMGHSPFSSLVKQFDLQRPGLTFDNSVLVEIAEKYGKTTAQIVLRWMADRNIVPIPKTIKHERLLENINIFDFKLEETEIKRINAFDTNTRFNLPSFWQDHKHYPFERVANPITDDPFTTHL